MGISIMERKKLIKEKINKIINLKPLTLRSKGLR